ncbi:hypothetical protein MKK75_02855 [Methylobacterium sp. J-030]|uniref:hypothetical protein n=1 Tax=Methylobacterium sp. J-030 TaxID=2836627 RepID=UPI001FB87DCA|nr:hypothetical protein [Methylobacterium sp. J-030]MCJ2067754.1 hypothetical protein [Methylobacterium sp. J-030]
MPLIAVKAVRAGACPPHPAAGPLPPDGGNWPDDQFTLRLIRDGAIAPLEAVEPDPAPASEPAPIEPAPAPAETKES